MQNSEKSQTLVKLTAAVLLLIVAQSAKALPNELVGVWTVAGAGTSVEFKANGYYYTVDSPKPYSINLAGTKLTWGGVIYDRIDMTPGPDVVGVWLDPAADEEINLRSNGTYSIHFRLTKEDYFGSFTYDLANIAISELRAIVTTNGGLITFDPPYGVPSSGVYQINAAGDQLTVTWANGASTIYNK